MNKDTSTMAGAVHMPHRGGDDTLADDAAVKKLYDDEIQKFLKKEGFQKVEPPVINARVIEVPSRLGHEEKQNHLFRYSSNLCNIYEII